MKYFLYRMSSKIVATNGGDFRSWLHFYKWGRPETVTFRRSGPPFNGAEKGDVLFFVLDGFLIGDAVIGDVRDGVYIEGRSSPVQEIDIPENGIWEYLRGWGNWNRYLDRLRMIGLNNEVPTERAMRWLAMYRDVGDNGPKGRIASYNPDVPPAFFDIEKK